MQTPRSPRAATSCAGWEAIGEEHWPWPAFALHTGFGQANQFALQWADLNFDTGTITARKPKGGTDYTAPMNDTARDLLRALPSRLKSRYVFPFEHWQHPDGITELHAPGRRAGAEEGKDRGPSLARPAAHVRVTYGDGWPPAAHGLEAARTQDVGHDASVCASGTGASSMRFDI